MARTDLDEAERHLAKPRNVIRSAILLMLLAEPGHGYDLMGRLEPLGVDRSNPGRVYRSLRWLEDQGWITPEWDTNSVAGPARRVYSTTPAGRDAVAVLGPTMRRSAGPDRIGRYVASGIRNRKNSGETFVLTATVMVTVKASSIEGAEKRVEHAFRAGPHWRAFAIEPRLQKVQ